MVAEVNTLGVATPAESPEVVESPVEVGHEETIESETGEHGETGTDKVEEFTPERYKNLQGEFTKTKQEFSEVKKQRDKDAEELAVYRKMNADQIKQQQANKPDPTKPLSAKDFANLEPMDQLNYLVDQRITETVNPYLGKIKQLEGYIQHTQRAEAQRTWNEFVAIHPDAANMAGELSQTITQHNMSLDKAYKLLKADQAIPDAKQEVLKEIQVKKDASKLMKPLSTPTTPINATVANFDEAWELTKKELAIK